MRRQNSAAMAALVLGGSLYGQDNPYIEKHMFSDLAPRGNTWTEVVADNFLYHNDGGGVRRFAFNQSSVPMGNEYFVFRANVSGLFGHILKSSNALGQPFYGYQVGSGASFGSAIHYYSPGARSSWNLALENSIAMRVFNDGDVDITGRVEAEAFALQAPRAEFGWVREIDAFTSPAANTFYSKIALRDGSQVFQFQSNYTDTDPLGDIQISLVRIDPAGVESVVAQITSTGTPGTTTGSTASISFPDVDNQNYAYYVKVFLGGPGVSFSNARYQYRVTDI